MTAAEGLDTLVGGAGSDIFRFDSQSKDGLDLVADFDGLPDRDTIDVGALLGIVTPATASGFLRAISLNGNTTLQIDTNGGADSFVDLAVLQGVSTDLDGLIANGAIVGIGTLISAPTAGTAGNDTLAAAATSTLVQGLAGNDSLAGGAGLDTLDGGTGTDTLAGGAGDDTYIVDSTKDAIAESSGANDRILASITIDLQNVVYDGIEHATLSGTGAINATGDDGVNMLIGNAGANKLDGKGGEDVMIGGAGSDTYEVDEQDDLVIEYAGEGTDQVNSLISYTLGDFQENLTLTGLAGISGNGNELGNKITGNAGDNFLSGNGGNDTLTGNDGSDQLHGGGGADSMTGGTGNDTYYFDDIGDKIAETSAAGGTDSVNSSLTYTLGANLEKLSLLGGADIDGTGNTLANVIVGNDGDNVLSGLTGNDTLEGAAGDDHAGRRRARSAAGRGRRGHAPGRRRQRHLRFRCDKAFRRPRRDRRLRRPGRRRPHRSLRPARRLQSRRRQHQQLPQDLDRERQHGPAGRPGRCRQRRQLRRRGRAAGVTTDILGLLSNGSLGARGLSADRRGLRRAPGATDLFLNCSEGALVSAHVGQPT